MSKSRKLSSLSKASAAILVVLMVSGCAFKPRTPAQQAKNSISYAAEAVSKGDGRSVQINIDYVTTLHGEAHHITKLFQDSPDAARLYVAAAAQYIDSITHPGGIATERDSLSVLRSAEALSAADLDALESRLIERAKRGNLDGTIRFELIDRTGSIGLLDSPEHSDRIIKHTIETTAKARSGPGRQVRQLMAYAADPSTPAPQKREIESSLDSLRITQSELIYVRNVYPGFAKRWEAGSTIKAMLVYSGGDKLVQADLMEALKGRIKGVAWQNDSGRDVALVKVDRLRYNEREDQRRQETVRYGDLDVDFAYRAFFMPRNSSYLYEIIASPISIEYGYEITVSRAGKSEHNEIVRGSLAAANSKCTGARVENAFGGSSPVDFWANDNMRARCGAGSEKSISDLRKEIESQVAGAILKSPSIHNVHSMNQ